MDQREVSKVSKTWLAGDDESKGLFWDLPEGPAQAKILLAEDQPDMRELLAHRLRSLGYEVIEAADGREMLQELEISDPDLIISDLHMPQLSGLEVLAHLRQSNQTTPFILMSAFADKATHIEATRLGATFVYNKPLDVQHLVSTVWAIVGP